MTVSNLKVPIIGATISGQCKPISLSAEREKSPSVIKTVAQASLAVLGGAGAMYMFSRWLGADMQHTAVLTRIDVSRIGIQSRGMPVIEVDLIPDQLLNINTGQGVDVKIDPNNYCPNAQSFTMSPLPAWLRLMNYTKLGSYDTPGLAEGVYVVGNIAYVADRAMGLQIINISSPSTPYLIGTFDTPGLALSVQVVGSTAFVADYDRGLQIINVTTPNMPSLLATFDTPGSAQEVQVVGNTAFVADGTSGLQIINVTIPNMPSLIATFDTPGTAQGVQVVGNTAFVADYDKGLQIINVSSLFAPSLLGSLSLAACPGLACGVLKVRVVGNIAFMAYYQGGIRIANVASPSAPFLIASFGTRSALDIQVAGNTAYIANFETSVQIVNVASPNTPFLIGTYGTPGEAHGIQVVGNSVFVADAIKGLQIFSLNNRNLLGVANKAGQVNLIATIGCLNFTATDHFTITTTQFPQTTGSQFSDISTLPGQMVNIPFSGKTYFSSKIAPLLSIRAQQINGQDLPSWLHFEMKPQLIAAFDAPVRESFKVNNVLYLASGTLGINILDITTPENPILLSKYPALGDAIGISVVNNTVIVANYYGLQFINVTNPSKPSLLKNFNTLDYTFQITVVDDTAFVTDAHGGLQIININSLSMLRYTPQGYIRALAVTSTTVFAVASDTFQGLHIINVIDKTKPSLLGSYATQGDAYAVAVVEDTVFVGDGYGLYIINVSNPSQPSLLGKYETPGSPYDISVVGETVFVSYDTGLNIIDISDKTKPSFFGNFNTLYSALSSTISGATAYVGTSGKLDILDLDNWYFIGTPSPADVGNYNIQVTAKDKYGGYATDTFIIRVEGPPVLTASLSNQQLKTGVSFTYFIDKSFFKDPNEDSLAFSASLASGAPLPSWLGFNPSIPGFLGTPTQSDIGILDILVTAVDPTKKSVTAPIRFTITQDTPQVLNQISSQTAQVNQPFQYVVSSTTFNDPARKLSYTAMLGNGQPLPSWLKFDQSSLTFTGTPRPDDTNVYVERRLEILLKASNGQESASTNFIIAVTGKSYPEQAINIGAPIISALSAMVGMYAKRALILNRVNKKKYTKEDISLAVGQGFTHQFSCDPQKIRNVTSSTLSTIGVTTKLYNKMDKSKLCCGKEMKHWTVVPHELHSWLTYDQNTAQIHSSGPAASDVGTILVQASGSAGVILEQFKIHVAAQNAIWTGETGVPLEDMGQELLPRYEV